MLVHEFANVDSLQVRHNNRGALNGVVQCGRLCWSSANTNTQTRTHTDAYTHNSQQPNREQAEAKGKARENERERKRTKENERDGDRQTDRLTVAHTNTHTHVVGWNRRVKGGSGKREQTAIRRSSSETRLPSSSRREGSDAMVRSRYMCSCVTPAFPFSATSAKAPCCATPLLKQCTTAS